VGATLRKQQQQQQQQQQQHTLLKIVVNGEVTLGYWVNQIISSSDTLTRVPIQQNIPSCRPRAVDELSDTWWYPKYSGLTL
jgi:hypothetical protein